MVAHDKFDLFSTRFSKATDWDRPKTTKGFIKLRLAHGARGSIVVPDMVFAKLPGWHYFLPSFFGPPVLVFDVPKKNSSSTMHTMEFSADFAAPDHKFGIRVIVKMNTTGHVRSYDDGAQLYECEVVHQSPLITSASGRCLSIEGEFWIAGFHHTLPDTIKLIRESGNFFGSLWNIQGTRKFKNVCYPYFTSLAKIQSDQDLTRIAMSNEGEIQLVGTGVPPVECCLKVYRENTANRTSTMKMWIPSAIVSPFHLRLFDPDSGGPSYYEVVNPEIIRIGLLPGKTLRFKGNWIVPNPEDLKMFPYVICGNANSRLGLQAPYDEEETSEVVHFEMLTEDDMFDFWRRHANSDQHSGRSPEGRVFD